MSVLEDYRVLAKDALALQKECAMCNGLGIYDAWCDCSGEWDFHICQCQYCSGEGWVVPHEAEWIGRLMQLLLMMYPGLEMYWLASNDQVSLEIVTYQKDFDLVPRGSGLTMEAALIATLINAKERDSDHDQ